MKSMLNKIKENKLYMMLGIIVIVFIIIILLVLLLSIFGGSRVRNYETLESKVRDAGISYFNSNKDRLPKEVKATTEVSIETLVGDGHLKEIEKLTPNKETCTGKVIAKNTNNDKINYEAYIDCGEYYKTRSIADYIKENTKVVTSMDGLYENNGDLVYRGEKINNYLTFAGRTYRIVSINSDNTLTIIDESETEKFYWDNRYNMDKKDNSGKDDYGLSKMRDGLTNVYNSALYFNDKDRSLLETQSLCVGKVNEANPISRLDGCQVTVDGDPVGLLTAGQFAYASLDQNCIYPQSRSCQNYNYLSKFGYPWWLLTTDYDTSYNGYMVTANGSVNEARLSSTAYFRDVLRISSNAVYVSGDGSKASPFVIK